jgi:hypothetical protein
MERIAAVETAGCRQIADGILRAWGVTQGARGR